MTENPPQDEERKDMSHDTENKQCQICKGYLFEDDDIVICPECGAPHHRDCWQALGRCGVEADHGTERQYDRLEAEKFSETADDKTEPRVCEHCHRESKAQGSFCPYCGQPYSGNRHQSHSRNNMGGNVFMGGMPFSVDIYGGIPKDSKIEDVKVEKLAKFVGNNSQRYIPRFATLNKHNKGSWNWAAFLSPAAWFMSRKMYLYGALFFLISLAAGLCGYPFFLEYETLLQELGTGATYSSYSIISQNLDKFSLLSMIMLFVGSSITVATRILIGRFGDWIYRTTALEKVRKISDNPEVQDVDTALAAAGSVSLLWMMVTFLAEQYLPSVIGSLIW